MLSIVRHKSALSGVHVVCSHSLKCRILCATEKLWKASGVGDGEGPPLVNPSAQEARCAGKSCHGPAMILPWSCLLLVLLFDMRNTLHELDSRDVAHALVNSSSVKARCASQPCLVA